jgi:NAD-dependent DNA ligase
MIANPYYEALTDADKCLVHRFLYYVLSRPIMHDFEYDQLERAASLDMHTPEDHPIQSPGSDLASSYPDEIQVIAYQLLHPELS